MVYEAVNDGDIGLLLYLCPGNPHASKLFATSAAKGGSTPADLVLGFKIYCVIQ